MSKPTQFSFSMAFFQILKQTAVLSFILYLYYVLHCLSDIAFCRNFLRVFTNLQLLICTDKLGSLWEGCILVKISRLDKSVKKQTYKHLQAVTGGAVMNTIRDQNGRKKSRTKSIQNVEELRTQKDENKGRASLQKHVKQKVMTDVFKGLPIIYTKKLESYI